MGLMSGIKANKAYRLQQKGQTDEAVRLYEEAFAEGLNDARFNLAYALLIIRKGEYQRAKDFLVAHQKAPGMTEEQRVTLLVDYAACCFRLGDLDKGIRVLEDQFRKTETGLLYQTLGYLYVEKYDEAHLPDFQALRAEAARKAEAEAEAARLAALQGEKPHRPQNELIGGKFPVVAPLADQDQPQPQVTLTPEEAWQQGLGKAEAFINKSVEYDDEDPICLDNMGQFLYRVKGDKAGAKKWFEKAIALKDSQIDTLWFLSRYDAEAGNTAAAVEKLSKALEGRFSPLNFCTRQDVEQELARLKGV